MECIGNCIKEVLAAEPGVSAVGLAFPGPFDYAKGVSAITGVGGKFESTFGLHVMQTLKKLYRGLHDVPFAFKNDAHCFAIGAYNRHQLTGKRNVFLTLGTGFGSAFMKDGVLLEHDQTLPVTGTFYDQPFFKIKQLKIIFQPAGFCKNINGERELTSHLLKNWPLVILNCPRLIFNHFGANLGKVFIAVVIKI